MKKTLFLTIVLITLVVISAQAFVIWDFNSSGSTPTHAYSYFPAMTTDLNYVTAGTGVGGSKALRIHVPQLLETKNANFVYLHNGLTNNINLNGNPFFSFAIMASNSNATSIGISLSVQDSTNSLGWYASKFIPPGVEWSEDSAQLKNTLGWTTTFFQMCWNLNSFEGYYYSPVSYIVYNYATQHPDLNVLRRFGFVFSIPKGSTQGAVDIYLDNIAASSSPQASGVPVPPEITAVRNENWTVFE